ncbi:MAG: TIGR03435 family protein [Bryobacteraceae bacterium]
MRLAGTLLSAIHSHVLQWMTTISIDAPCSHQQSWFLLMPSTNAFPIMIPGRRAAVSQRWTAIALLVIARWAQPQDGGASAPAFEVASIRPSGPHSIRRSSGGPGTSDPGLYRFGLATLLDLICIGYDVRKWQVQSPIALEPQAFDLAAEVPARATKEQFRAMLQNLLADRFHLKLHIQSKQFPAYELLIAKTGFKLKDGAAAQPVSGLGWPPLRPSGPSLLSLK